MADLPKIGKLYYWRRVDKEPLHCWNEGESWSIPHDEMFVLLEIEIQDREAGTLKVLTRDGTVTFARYCPLHNLSLVEE